MPQKKQVNFFELQTTLKKSNTTSYALRDQVFKGVHPLLEWRHPQQIVSVGADEETELSPLEVGQGKNLWEYKDIHAGIG